VNAVLSTDKLTVVNQGTEVFNASAINVSYATSLGQALDIAANADGSTNGQISWFQYQGNTYLLDDNSASADLAAADVIVKFVGTVDLSSLTQAGNVFTF
jgi:S-layer protein